MGQTTGIEWTDATWNPVTGCTQVSAGCDHCYAKTLAHRLLSDHYTRRTPVNDTADTRTDPFAVRLWPERLRDPHNWATARRVFVNSMSDLFHGDIPEAFVREIFRVMLDTPRHVYQVLTKRPGRMARFVRRNADLFVSGVVPGHIWLGASVENQRASHRVSQLRLVPAEMRFLSCEPLLGPLRLDLAEIDWVIVGGESGTVHRQMDLEWARAIRDQCSAANVAFFFKQVGGRTPKAGGRLLDGREWDEYPEIDLVTSA
ncbi:MAG: phage Gp37/Gp68 family protein [Gemmatimonadetes bacterium]|nr:phage Gp37/Gp68 family protein [Gemmatimonadota bacterium]